MDSIDAKIVSLLHSQGRISAKKLASEVFLSAPATKSRIEKLEQEGIITGYKACVNLSKLGLDITAYINFTLEEGNNRQFLSFISNEPHIISCDCVEGMFTHILKGVFSSTKQLGDFLKRLRTLGCAQVNIITDTVKDFEHTDLAELIINRD